MQNPKKLFIALSLSTLLGTSLGMTATKLFQSETETDSTQTQIETPEDPVDLTVTEAGGTFETTVSTEGIGKILVQVELPKVPRYEEGAPVLVSVPNFFTPGSDSYHPLEGVVEEGMISIALVSPGRSDDTGQMSEGENDYGGSDSIKALRDVILFALGDKTNSDGFTLDELSAIQPIYDDVGVFAFSHQGLAATAVLGSYPEELSNLAFFVGRENPTTDLTSTLELGHWETEGKQQIEDVNPVYESSDYSQDLIHLDYSSVNYDNTSDSPYFDTNHNNRLDEDEFSLGTQIPKMFGLRYYSKALLHALEDNGALNTNNWPADLVTPEVADAIWPSRESTTYYPKLKSLSKLHTLLVFAIQDHVQVTQDKPHIHQAYDGLSSAGLWIRLNPDQAYVSYFDEKTGKSFTEHDANSEPTDWDTINSWAYNSTGISTAIVALAGVFEMADRSHFNNWSNDLSTPLNP